MSDSNGSPAALIKSKQFLPYFLTQVMGAFNDNVFKNALILMVTFAAANSLPFDSNIMINAAAGLFILPFFLFSATAGALADNVEKSKLIRIIKLAEVGLMSLAALSLYFENYLALFGLLFMMGTQSAFFGPVKYAILPQLVKPEGLIGANALVEMGTFIAILAGTITGGLLIGLENATVMVAACVVAFSIVGYLSSLKIPKVQTTGTGKRVGFHPVRQTIDTIKISYGNRTIFLSIMAISWFWFMGASYLTQFANLSKLHLNGNNEVVTLLLVAFSVGVALGSMVCERLSGGKVELGLVPIGSLGMSIFGIELFLATNGLNASGDLMGFSAFMSQPHAYRVLFDLSMIGVFGGCFIVPLYAMLQQRSDEGERARVIAANNIFNAIYMVVSAVAAGVILGLMGLSIPEYILVLSLMNLVVAAYVYWQVPEFVLRFFIWILSHTMYRVKHKGLHNIPDEGGVVLVCNHVSFVDALLIAGAVRRPMRFVMDKNIFNSPGLHWFFKIAKTIPITSQKQDPELFAQAFDTISGALKNGEVVCIFPEGKLTRNGEMNTFRPGIEWIVERDGVPVVPMALKGLWGSFFSHEGKGAFKAGAGRWWSRVELEASVPVAAEEVSAELLQGRVSTLRGDNA